MVSLLSLLAYLLYALWVGRRSLTVAGKQTSSVTDIIHYEYMIDILFIVFTEFSRYGKFLEFFFPEKFRKVSDILFFRKSYNPNIDT